MFIYQGSIITNFLSQNGQQYKIPVYQRNYEWSKEQCKKLFDKYDIERSDFFYSARSTKTVSTETE